MSLSEPTKCFICEEPASADSFGSFQAEYRFSCQVCGAYRVSNPLAMSRFGMEEERIPYLKAATRQASESGDFLLLTPENIESLAEQHRTVSFTQKIDLFLRFVASKCNHPGAVFPADFNTIYPLFDCVNSAELFEYVLHLQRNGLLGRDDKAVWPTVEGWQSLEPTLRVGGESDRCFVAMWFDDKRGGVEGTATTPEGEAMTRDPRSDPQRGDELRGDGQIRRVIAREGGMLRIESGRIRYWMRLDRWQSWCVKSGAQAAAAKQEGSSVSL